jgi:hypothetical protein
MFGIYLSLMLATGMIFSLVNVMADNSSNDYITGAELVVEGTYTGTVGEGDYSDWYKFNVPGHETVYVEAILKDAEEGDEVYATTTDSSGIPDDQVYIEVFPGESKDHCHWTNYEEDIARVMYIQVTGDGSYELTIEFEDDSETDELFDMLCCGLTIIPLTILIALLLGISIYIKKGNRDSI